MRIFFLLTGLIFLLASCSSNDENRLYTKFDASLIKKDFEAFRLIIKYAHPGKHFHCTPKELDKLFDSVEATLDKPHTEIEFYKKLLIITKKIACAHTSLYPSNVLSDTIFNQQILFPIPIISINKKFYVNSDDAAIPYASEILTINNEKPEQIINKIAVLKMKMETAKVMWKKILHEVFILQIIY